MRSLRDTLQILPKANHDQFEAKVGSNAEMPSLRGFLPEYSTTIREWLAKRPRRTDSSLLLPQTHAAAHGFIGPFSFHASSKNPCDST